MSETKWIRQTEVAKIIRKDLKDSFPNTKFSVRSDNSINVSWVDGVCEKKVKEVIGKYESKGFDGMIDLEYSIRHWQLPDGSIVMRGSEGTSDSRGYVSSWKSDRPHPDAVEVSLGTGYLFTHRTISDDLELQIAKDLALAAEIEFKGMQDVVDKGHYRNWYNLVYAFTYTKDLDGYSGVEHDDSITSCSGDQFFGFYKITYKEEVEA